MNSILFILIVLVRLFVLLLVLRIIVEMIQGFSRNWRPQRWFSILAEPVFVITDPPVKLLRRFIPPLQLGGVALDISILVLFFALSLLTRLLTSAVVLPLI